MIIRKALISEFPGIRRLLAQFEGPVLMRPLAEMYTFTRDYWVAFDAEIERLCHEIIGVGALHVCWEGLGEVRSLAVQTERQHSGVGTALMERCLLEAREMGLKEVFLFAQATEFFARFGFQEVSRACLPPAAFVDCASCVLFPDCNEVPMLKCLCVHEEVEITAMGDPERSFLCSKCEVTWNRPWGEDIG